MNDQLGCCVISGGYHLVGAFTGNAGNEFVASDQQIISDYSAIGGYVPGRPDTDNGCDEETALNYWMKQGFQNGTKLAGWLSVDPSNQTELQQAVAIFEHVYWGMEMPDQWINQAMPQFPGGSLASPAAVWDMAGDPNPDNGHCITSFAFNASGLLTDTWGSLVSLTWEAAAYYGGSNQDGEAYVVLSPDLLNAASQKAPNALDWASLVADFNSMGGNVTPPPAPPAPPPTPPPNPTPTPAANLVLSAPLAAGAYDVSPSSNSSARATLISNKQRLLALYVVHRMRHLGTPSLKAQARECYRRLDAQGIDWQLLEQIGEILLTEPLTEAIPAILALLEGT
jgi:hypothetical protein